MVYKEFLLAEPIQWGANYLQGLLETLEESSLESSYGIPLLALEREELQEIWNSLMDSHTYRKENNVLLACGVQGARLFVIHHLMSTLPQRRQYSLHEQNSLFHTSCKHLVDAYFFLSIFKPLNKEKALCLDTIDHALNIVARERMLSKLSLSGNPLHIYSLDYNLPRSTYYLSSSHTIICGAGSANYHIQLYDLLHELGHVLYLKKFNNPLKADNILRKQAAEKFAARFAEKVFTPAR